MQIDSYRLSSSRPQVFDQVVKFILGQVVGAAMLVFGVEDGPDFFERARRAVMQIRCGDRDVRQLRRVEQARVDLSLSLCPRRTTSDWCPWARCGNTNNDSSRGIGLPNLSTERSKRALPRSCAGVSSPPGKRQRFGRERQAAHVDCQIREREVVIVLRAPEVFLRARSALGGNVRIAAIPLEGLGASQIFNAAGCRRYRRPNPSGSRSHVSPSKVESIWQLAQPIWPWNE